MDFRIEMPLLGFRGCIMHVESVTSIESLKSETGCFDSSNNGTATLVFLLEKEHFRRVSCDAMLNLLRESFIFSLLASDFSLRTFYV